MKKNVITKIGIVTLILVLIVGVSYYFTIKSDIEFFESKEVYKENLSENKAFTIFDIKGASFVNEIINTSDGYSVVGNDNKSGYIISYDSNWNELWRGKSNTYFLNASKNDLIKYINVIHYEESKETLVLGVVYLEGGVEKNYFIHKYDQKGNLIWEELLLEKTEIDSPTLSKIDEEALFGYRLGGKILIKKVDLQKEEIFDFELAAGEFWEVNDIYFNEYIYILISEKQADGSYGRTLLSFDKEYHVISKSILEGYSEMWSQKNSMVKANDNTFLVGTKEGNLVTYKITDGSKAEEILCNMAEISGKVNFKTVVKYLDYMAVLAVNNGYSTIYIIDIDGNIIDSKIIGNRDLPEASKDIKLSGLAVDKDGRLIAYGYSTSSLYVPFNKSFNTSNGVIFKFDENLNYY